MFIKEISFILLPANALFDKYFTLFKETYSAFDERKAFEAIIRQSSLICICLRDLFAFINIKCSLLFAFKYFPSGSLTIKFLELANVFSSIDWISPTIYTSSMFGQLDKKLSILQSSLNIITVLTFLFSSATDVILTTFL